MRRLCCLIGFIAWLAIGAGVPEARGENQFIVLQSTTSTQNSGLYDAILPQFTAKAGIDIRVVAVGTGQAIKNARNCDGDVLLVHARGLEEKFVAEGFGTFRADVMYNDFILVGPRNDPAKVTGMDDIAGALRNISGIGALFASRGDESGTHRRELALWQKAGVGFNDASSLWYRETGSGMGATLNVAVGMGAYVLTDRASWVTFANKDSYVIHVEGDEALYNQYGVIPVSPRRCKNVKGRIAGIFVDWVLSEAGQVAIASYRRDGIQLFHPNAVPR